MKVQYIGKNSKHRDRLYGTGTRWNGRGDVQEIDDDVAAVMISKHPDVYALASEGSLADANREPPPENNANPADTGDQKPTIETAQVKIDGEFYPLSKLKKAALDAYAKEHFGVDLDQRLKQADLAQQVLELLESTPDEGGDSEDNGDENGDS